MAKSDSDYQDISSLNQNILHIDLDDIEVEAMEQRVELTLASLFGDLSDGPMQADAPCGSFSCSGYFPVR